MPKEISDNRFFSVYIDVLNETLNKTITVSRLTMQSIRGSKSRAVGRFAGVDVLPLELKPSGNCLFVSQDIHREDNKVIVESCTYRFSRSDDPSDEEAWVFRYDYVRFAGNNHPHTHIHVNANHRFTGQDLHHIHFPSARLSLEQLIAYLILEHGVELLSGVNHDEAMRLLQRNHTEFMRRRTDHEVFP